MKSINAREAQNHFGNLMNSAIKEPVIINKYGKPFSVLMSYEEYEHFNKFEDFYWAIKADESKKNGLLTKEKTNEFFDKILEE
ncbi:type II toxin-antitoxin system Phd/YefM family antitoxin [Candidatus Tisiphia endosymbiont of Hybos culiciformis]|uniref:type II toxin-antitoxin system Phd/YefM family antitoxin n=1 Tax=Candidatus Tisiphia endosymbiont of Hybos culiciformis TaxID=3139331 RepID=UPI003CCB4D8B